MRILFLQDAGYLSWGAGVKVNRFLCHQLSERGHECQAVVSTGGLGEISHNPLQEEGWEIIESAATSFQVLDRGTLVTVYHQLENYGAAARKAVHEFDPDIVLMNESRSYRRLEVFDAGQLERFVITVHCLEWLPFGPAAILPDSRAEVLFKQVGGAITVCDYLRQYIARYGGCEAKVLGFPAYGRGPYPPYGRFGQGLVMMVNLSPIKGAPVFLEMARRFPSARFGAVRSWATSDSDLEAADEIPNLEVLDPHPNIDRILSRTGILVVPSLWQEAFPLTVIEAMLRGIPVLASRVGGLPEAKLGTDYVIPVRPVQKWQPVIDSSGLHIQPVIPEQDLTPWYEALGRLLEDREEYERMSAVSRKAALGFVEGLRTDPFEEFLEAVAAGASTTF